MKPTWNWVQNAALLVTVPAPAYGSLMLWLWPQMLVPVFLWVTPVLLLSHIVLMLTDKTPCQDPI